MTCSAASTLSSTASIPLPSVPGLTSAQNQALKRWGQNILQQIQGAAGTTGVNVVPQQYALLAANTLPPISGLSNCTVAQDGATPLFGAGGSYKISITGSPATVTFSVDTAWPLHPGWQWIASFFQQASAAIAGVLTITTPTKAYTTDFTTTLSAKGWQRLFDALNLGADTSTTFGLSFTFTGGTGQTVWLDGLMMEPYFNVAMNPSPFISTSAPLTLDNNPDGSYSKILTTHTSGNVAFNYKGVWNGATGYVIGDEVLYGQSYWIAVAPSTGSAPPSAAWQVVGSYSAFLGAWSSITTYAVGAEVTYNGNFWIAVAQNSNSAPTTSNANWQVAGPTSLQAIADGSSRFAVTNGANLKGVGSVDGSNLALINFASGGHLNQILDYLANGTYGKILASGLSGSKLTAAGMNNGAVSSVASYSVADTFNTPGTTTTILTESFTGAYTTIIHATCQLQSSPGIDAIYEEVVLSIDGTAYDDKFVKLYGSGSSGYQLGIDMLAFLSDPAEGPHTVTIKMTNHDSTYDMHIGITNLVILRLLN